MPPLRLAPPTSSHPRPTPRRWSRLPNALALAALALASCERTTSASTPPSATADAPAALKPLPLAQAAPSATATAAAARLAPSIRDLAVDLHRQLATGDGNTLVSPTSVAIALGLVQLGGRGDTAAELARALHLPAASADGAALAGLSAVLQGKGARWELASANRLWAAERFTLEPAYLASTGVGLERLDFSKPDAAARAINGWIAAQTRNRITDLVPASQLKPSTRLVLTNALYLKAAWSTPFEPALTTDGRFTLLDGTAAATRLMHQTDHFRLAAIGGAHAVELPYDGGALSFVAILPDDPAAFRSYERDLDGPRLQALLDGLTSQQVAVTLPRSQIRERVSLREALEALGVRAAFGNTADFSGISGDRSLLIDAVLHESFMRLDEQGTEAAAATAVLMNDAAAMAGSEPYAFVADRPFLYLIRHNPTGAILFMGRMATPAPIP